MGATALRVSADFGAEGKGKWSPRGRGTSRLAAILAEQMRTAGRRRTKRPNVDETRSQYDRIWVNPAFAAAAGVPEIGGGAWLDMDSWKAPAAFQAAVPAGRRPDGRD